MIAASFLMGMDHASGTLALADGFFTSTTGSEQALPFEEAVKYFKGKIAMTEDEWNALEPKLRIRAFSVAALASCDHVEMLRGRLIAALETGEGFEASWEDAKAIAADAGLEIRPGYWESVYRTNIQTAYTAGTLLQYQNNPPPAWELLIIDDSRTSDKCRSLLSAIGQGHALPAQHPFWKTYGFPPYHIGCRTDLRAVYAYEVDRITKVENVPMKQLRSAFKPQAGFGGNPLDKESFWKLTPAMVERADRYGMTEDIVTLTHDLDMHSYYPELLKRYDTVYKGKQGGIVKAATNWAEHESPVTLEEKKKEIEAAIRLADMGHNIYLLPRSKKAPSVDMIIDNELGEIKHATGHSYKNIIEKAKDAGHRQRTRVLYLGVNDTWELAEARNVIQEACKGTPITKVFLAYKNAVYVFRP